MAFNFRNRNELQAPGAGLPWLERLLLDATFKSVCTVVSDQRALKLFEKESKELFRLADEDESYDVFSELLIPRVIGIEDSSRKWSVMMVLEHLFMTNRDMLTCIKALMDGIVPRGMIDVADYKPSNYIGYEVLEKYQQSNAEYVRTIQDLLNEHGSLVSEVRYAHPWFGKLSAHQWHCLAAVHQRLHRRQATKLVAMLGVV